MTDSKLSKIKEKIVNMLNKDPNQKKRFGKHQKRHRRGGTDWGKFLDEEDRRVYRRGWDGTFKKP